MGHLLLCVEDEEEADAKNWGANHEDYKYVPAPLWNHAEADGLEDVVLENAIDSLRHLHDKTLRLFFELFHALESPGNVLDVLVIRI